MENSSACFILLPGFAPDNVPVLHLKALLEEKGFAAIATNFYGEKSVEDFSLLSIEDCQKNITDLISASKKKYKNVFGIGISLGGALLLEYAKRENGLDAIVSIGSPFKLKNKRKISVGRKILPLIVPVWKKMEKIKRLRPIPLGFAEEMIKYLEGDFIKEVEKIKTPVLFIHSKKDWVTDHRVAKEFSQKMLNKKNRFIYFDNGGHVINGNSGKVIGYIVEFLATLK
jgi:esterase/lipase